MEIWPRADIYLAKSQKAKRGRGKKSQENFHFFSFDGSPKPPCKKRMLPFICSLLLFISQHLKGQKRKVFSRIGHLISYVFLHYQLCLKTRNRQYIFQGPMGQF